MKHKVLLNPVLVLSLILALTASILEAPAALADAGGTWTTRASMPTARTGLGIVAASNGKVYAIGGWDGPTGYALATVEEYDPTTDTWTGRASMPTARENLGVVKASNGKIYAIGGDNPSSILATVEEYDVATNTWVTRASMPTARTAPGVVATTNGKIYVMGGANNGSLATVEEYDVATNTWVARAGMPTTRHSLGAAVASNGKIYAIGGTNTGNESSLDTVEAYDPATNTWTTRASMPTARQSFGMVAASNGRLYAIGGWLYWSVQVATVEEYDPVTDTWTTRTSMPTARYMLGATEATNGKIYAIGGRIYLAPSEVAAVEEFTPPFFDSFTVSIDHLALPDLYDNADPSSEFGQTFVAQDTRMTGVRLYLSDPSRPQDSSVNELVGPADLVLYDAANLSQPTEIARSLVASSGITLQGLVLLAFDSPVATVVGHRYFFAISTSDGYGVGLRTQYSSTYPGGAEATRDPVTGVIAESSLGRDLSFQVLTLPETGAFLMANSTSGNELYPGDPVSVDLTLQNANNLYAAQATCLVNPTILEPQSGVFGDFFDPVNHLIGANNANASAGSWTGAISQRSPAAPLTGEGLFATITYTAQEAGTATVICDPLLSDQDGFTQPVNFIGTDITVLPFATVDSTAQYQGRVDHTGITLTATGSETFTTVTDSLGNFILSLKTGIYTLTASAAGYLSNSLTITVTSGDTITLSGTTLKGGSVNGDNVIDIGDATLVAANFGLTVPPGDDRADINGDGVVNVQDLAILGSNYGLTGDQAW